jgi:hypothetical protein
MAGAITDADRSFIEEWENISTQQHTIVKFDYRGDMKHEMVNIPGHHFRLTTAERLVTEERILKKEDDPFRNGAFRPVIVPDSVSIESNPNALSDDEIKSILVSSALAWENWMEVIDAPATLARMIDLANQVDGVTLARFKEIEARLTDARPQQRVTNKDRDQLERLGA